MATGQNDSLYGVGQSRLHKHLHKHIAKHIHTIHRHLYTVQKIHEHVHHVFAHLWELIVVWIFAFFGLMHAWSASLPNNSSFSYPLQKVSTVDCRTLYWEDMPDSCKINLPIIRGANYSAYVWNSLYRSIYTTLWAAPYSNTWDQAVWAHAGVDIATARGTPIYSIWNGVVFYAWRNSSYGNVIKVKYVYKWEVVYAVYAHLDTIEVSAWDTVTRWQKIWTTWNSGNTFWALGWYHLHFEIDKDNGWRPAYSYTNCKYVDKWHYTIIQNGLCREELFRYQYDPIRVLEWVATPSLDAIWHKETVENVDTNIIAKADEDQPTVVEPNEDSHESANDTQQQGTQPVVNNNPQDNNTVQNKPVEEKPVENKPVENNNTQNNQTVNNDSQNNSQNNNSQNTQPVENKPIENKPVENQPVENKPVEEKPVENKPIEDKPNENNNNPVVAPETNSQPNNDTQNNNQNKDPEMIELNFSKLTKLNQHFMTQWDVEMKSKLKVKSLNVWETLTIDIEVFKKWTAENKEYYNNGTLQVPFGFINNNDNISLNITSLQLLNKWKWKIEITGEKPGSSAVVLQIWWEKIWVLNISVK